MATLCRITRGCVHPPNHLGVCEINRNAPKKLGLEPALTFLDQQERTAQLIGRAAEELALVVGASTAMFEGGLTRDALALLVQAKCRNGANGHPIPISTVHNVLNALSSLGEFLK